MEEKNIVERIRDFVRRECEKPSNKYGKEVFERHFVNVVCIAKNLAEKKMADIEVVEIAAWLHDIGSVVYGRENHHITSGEIAEKKLREEGYDEFKIQKIKNCIFTHRGSQGKPPESNEAKILAEADSMDAFNRIEGLFMAAYQEGLNQKEALVSVRDKLKRKYFQLSEEGREIIKPKFEAAMLLLNGD